ncbi:hypothetical protein [Anianabacter salinae]|nr:hypothetical protein [Anianabacter salinae]
MFRWLFRLILIALLFGGIGLVGYAYLGDLSPDQSDVTTPVILNAD